MKPCPKSSRKSKATTKNADAIRKVMSIHEAVEFEEKGKTIFKQCNEVECMYVHTTLVHIYLRT